MRPDFKHVSFVVFCAFAVKLLILQDITAFSALSFLISASVVAFYEFKVSLHQIKQQDAKLDAISKHIAALEQADLDINGKISSIRLVQGMTNQAKR